MAFDGVTIANIVYELNQELAGSRLYKIAQPEEDELLLTFKTKDGQKKLFLSADASLNLSDCREQTKPHDSTQFLYAAAQAPAECPSHCHSPARSGAHCPDGTGASGRNGGFVPQRADY